MIYGFIKDKRCINVAEFENEKSVQEISDILAPSQFDEIVPCADGFGIGDFYVDGGWSKTISTAEPPSIEDRVAAIEEVLLTML